MVVGVGVLLSALAFGVQQYSLDHYNLVLDIPERLWVQLGAGWAFLIAGLAGRMARPESRIGWWLVAFGLTWMGRLVFTAPLIQWEAVGWAVAFYGILFVILYTFPTGRLRGWERWAAGAWMGFVIVIAVWVIALEDFYGWVDDSVCCPPHLLFVGENPMLQERIFVWGLVVASVVFTGVGVAQVFKWRRSTIVARRNLTPVVAVLLPFMALLVLIPVVNAISGGVSGFLPDASGGGLSPSPTPGRLNLYVQNGALVILPGLMLAGLLGVRLSRARVADLVQDLGSATTPEDLEARLRETLADPHALLAFQLEGSDEYVNVDGKAIRLADEDDRLVTSLDRGVSIVHDPAVDSALVVSAGMAASLATTNAHLQAELRAQLLELQESRRRLVTATDEARRSVERDLHDGAQQRLVALAATLKKALDSRPVDDPVVDELLAAAAREANLAIGELRELARGVHPAILTQAGLDPAVSSLVDRAPIPVSVDIGAGRFPPEAETTAYFVIAEALSNVFKHAHATRAQVVVKTATDALTIEVDDDGIGNADPDGSGISGLRDRVGALGGALDVGSSHLGGTKLTAVIRTSEQPS